MPSDSMFHAIATRLSELFSPESLADYIAQRLPSVTVAVITIAFFVLLWKVLQRGARSLMQRTELDETAQRFVETVLKYAVLTIGIVSALAEVGVNTGSVLASLGVLGLTIGFAAQDTLSNLISGIFIFWDRPFVIGDLVEIGGNYGRVSEITMRSTRVVTVDGKMLAIPNREVVNSTVASYTNFPNLRIDVAVTISVDESIDRVRKIMLDMVRGDERYMTEPAPSVVVQALNDYNLELVFRAWLEDERQHVAARFELREKVYKALYEAGVDMPYEHVTVTMKGDALAA